MLLIVLSKVTIRIAITLYTLHVQISHFSCVGLFPPILSDFYVLPFQFGIYKICSLWHHLHQWNCYSAWSFTTLTVMITSPWLPFHHHSWLQIIPISFSKIFFSSMTLTIFILLSLTSHSSFLSLAVKSSIDLLLSLRLLSLSHGEE